MSVSSVKATVDGQTVTLTYNSTTGKYEGTLTAPGTTSYNQPSHVYGVSISATDDAGNTSTVDSSDSKLGSSLKLTVKETVAPTISVTSPSSGARVTNNKPPITFSIVDEANGSGIDLETLALKLDGGTAIGNASAGMVCTSITNGYMCIYTPQTALADGTHSFTIDVSDHDGNTATQVSSGFTSDTVAPSLNITSPVNSLVTNNSSLTVVGTTNDSTSSPVTIAIKLNGIDQGAVAVSSGNFSKALTLAIGGNTIAVTATDSAGLQSTVTRTVKLDQTAPNITAVAITPQSTTTGHTYTISVTVTDG